MTGVLRRRRENMKRGSRGEKAGLVETKQIRVRLPYAKECVELPAAGGGEEGLSLRASGGSVVLPTP